MFHCFVPFAVKRLNFGSAQPLTLLSPSVTRTTTETETTYLWLYLGELPFLQFNLIKMFIILLNFQQNHFFIIQHFLLIASRRGAVTPPQPQLLSVFNILSYGWFTFPLMMLIVFHFIKIELNCSNEWWKWRWWHYLVLMVRRRCWGIKWKLTTTTMWWQNVKRIKLLLCLFLSFAFWHLNN